MADQPTYTRIPNDIIEAMPKLGNAELRVLLAIARKTYGWQKECDVISTRQIEDMTGLGHRHVLAALDAVLEKGLISRTPAKRRGFCYRLVPLGDQFPKVTSPPRVPDLVPLGDQSDENTVPLGDQQKKDLKKRKEKIRAPRKSADAPAEKTPHQKIMDAYASALAYPIRDGPKEGNAAKWLVNNNYTPEQVTACYAHLKVQAFYANQHVSLQTVASQIGAYLQSKNGHSNGKLLRQSATGNSERKPQREANLDDGF